MKRAAKIYLMMTLAILTGNLLGWAIQISLLGYEPFKIEPFEYFYMSLIIVFFSERTLKDK